MATPSAPRTPEPTTTSMTCSSWWRSSTSCVQFPPGRRSLRARLLGASGHAAALEAWQNPWEVCMEGKVKASKVKVHQPPEGTGGLDGQFHVYIYDVFNQAFSGGRSFETVEKAVSFQRHEQERIYLEQEADPELF